MLDMKKLNNIESQVKKELCFQCGTCESICPKSCIKMKLDKNRGLIYPLVDNNICINCGKCIKVCPVNHIDSNIENHLVKADEIIETYSSANNEILYKSTSGGLATSIISYLFDKSEINKAIVVGMDENNPIQAKSYIVTKKEDLKPSSVYQPVALNEMLKYISKEDRVAYVGLPCHIRGLNQYLKLNKKLENSFVIKIGLMCTIGRGLNGTKLALYKHNINEESIKDLKYRVGNHPSSMTIDSSRKIGMGEYLKYIDYLFYPRGCSYCNDLFNDECDISLGDPWGKIDKKVCMSIIRNKKVKDILDDMVKLGYITKEDKELSNIDVMETQKSGVNYKIKSYINRIALYRKLGIKDNINIVTDSVRVKLNAKNVGLVLLILNSKLFNSKFGYNLFKYVPSKLITYYRHKVYSLCTKD